MLNAKQMFNYSKLLVKFVHPFLMFLSDSDDKTAQENVQLTFITQQVGLYVCKHLLHSKNLIHHSIILLTEICILTEFDNSLSVKSLFP